MPNFSGIWTVTQQMQALGARTWPAPPGAPTIGTASQASATSVSVPFTAPACTGYPACVTGYQATSTPGCLSNTGASSPIVVSGLTTDTAYTFKVKATNTSGYGAASAASNSVTPVTQGQQAYTTAGTYTWVAPALVTSVSVVSVGAGGGAGGGNCNNFYGAGGGALAYANNISVTPGNSYTAVVGAGGINVLYCAGNNGGNSTFNSTSVGAQGGRGSIGGSNGAGGTVLNGTGSSGGRGGCSNGGSCGQFQGAGGGAGGYSAAGGRGGDSGGNGVGSTGGGGGGGKQYGGGGGVGILGAEGNGAGATSNNGQGFGGSGGSGGGVGGSANTSGAAYGGGSGYAGVCTGKGAVGAVRIIWPGNTRSFPSTNTGNM